MANLFALASGSTTNVIGPDAWASLLTALTNQISVTSIVGVLASVVGAAIGMVFMWWGVRKLGRVLMAAFRSGKLKF